MALFELKADEIVSVAATQFGEEGVRERADLQRLLRAHIDVVSPETMIIAEEFGEWEDSRRRIDLLGLDKQANLVVIELKRTEDGGHMELQAIRYAAMVSTVTFEQAVAARAEYQRRLGIEDDPQAAVLSFLEWDEPNEDRFAQEIRIVLVAADFSKELTTSVMWLNSYDIDICCVRLRPYRLDERILLDVQQIIPLPEAVDYQVQVREKTQRERQAREYSNDFTRFDVTVDGEVHTALWKRGAILLVVRKLVTDGTDPQKITDALEQPAQRLWRVVEGEVDAATFRTRASEESRQGGTFDSRRWFCGDDELIHFGSRTYAFSNQWGGASWHEAMKRIVAAFPKSVIKYEPTK